MNEHNPDLPSESLNTRRAMLAGIGGLAAGAFLASTANAGPLAPPPGPIAPTPGPEPRTAIDQTNTPGDANSTYLITRPGSYYLTGNVVGQSGRQGITIAASGVTLDLMGFEVVGVEGALSGIATTGTSRRNIAVVNGMVRDWPGAGVGLGGSGNTANRIERITASGNGSAGISLSTNSTVIDCVAWSNGGNGFTLNSGSIAQNCVASVSGSHGFSVSVRCIVSHCNATNNSGSGFNVSASSRVDACLATLNDESGIRVSTDSVVRNCVCDSNGTSGNDAGITATGADNRIEGNQCTGNFAGIACSSVGNFIIGNSCSGNSTNWSIVANNICLVVSAALAPNILGNSGGTSPGSTNPYANFTY